MVLRKGVSHLSFCGCPRDVLREKEGREGGRKEGRKEACTHVTRCHALPNFTINSFQGAGLPCRESNHGHISHFLRGGASAHVGS